MDKRCGNCMRFGFEDLDGYGWCYNTDEERYVSDHCDLWEPLAQAEPKP